MLYRTFRMNKRLISFTGEQLQKAKIFSENTEVPEGGILEVTCSTYGFTKPEAKSVYVYLCKDGKAIDMKYRSTRQDIAFKIERTEMDHSGNYSCLFSEEHLEKNKVMGYGNNIIFINVIGKMYDTSAYI